MPKYFGENNPEISDALLMNILSYVDNRALSLILPQVSSGWRLITRSKQLHKNILKAIFKRTGFFHFNNLEFNVEIISSGYTNTNYKILKDEEYYVLRIPIMKNHILINRHNERHNMIVACELGLGAALMFYEKSTGIMATKYIDNENCLTKEQLTNQDILITISRSLKLLHKTSRKFLEDWVIFNKIQELYNFIIENNLFYNKKILELLMKETNRVKHSVDKLNIKLCPCHNDLSPNNILLLGNDIRIIDWEFSGNNDPIWDLAFLSTISELSFKDENVLLFAYFNGSPVEVDFHRFLLYKPIVHFWVGLLSLLQIYNCNERLGKNWLAKIAEDKFNKAKALFEQSNELVDKLQQVSKSEEVSSKASHSLIPDSTIPSPVLFSTKKIHAGNQENTKKAELKFDN
jgi:thiamine kinase-like enzyme